MALEVSKFATAAAQATQKHGYVAIKDAGDGKGPELVVKGTSRWSRFVRSLGLSASANFSHEATNKALGRAVRAEYGDEFFKTIPSKLRRQMEQGWTPEIAGNSSRKLIAQVKLLTDEHKGSIDKTVQANKDTVDRHLDRPMADVLKSTGGRAYEGLTEKVAKDPKFKDKVKAELADRLHPDYKRMEMPELSAAEVDDAVRRVVTREYLGALPLAQKSSTDAKVDFSLRGLKSQLGQDPADPHLPNLPKHNEDFSSRHIGKPFGKYVIYDRKKLGVEPGFVARKTWSQDHADKMLNLGQGSKQGAQPHRYAELATRVYLRCMDDDEVIACARSKRVASDQAVKAILENGSDDPKKAAQLRAVLEQDADLRYKALDKDFKTILGKVEADGTAGTKLDAKYQVRYKVMKAAVETQTDTFNKNHYVKLDYHQRTWTNKLPLVPYKYARPEREGVEGMTLVTDRVVRWWKSATPKDLNEGAVKEALANDLTRALGVPTQKLKLVASEFPQTSASASPKVKLLLDGTHVTGNKPGEFYSDLTPHMSGRGERQVLVKTKTVTDATGKPRIEPENRNTDGSDVFVMEADARENMGRYKAVFTLLADVDAVGSKGQNKGTVGRQFFAIDPGHSLDKRSMQGEVPASDFRIKSEGQGTYKNFSVFDQSPYSERMRGLQDTLRRIEGDDVKGLFASYQQQFGAEGSGARINGVLRDELVHDDKVTAWKQLLDDRAQRFKETFSDRLAVYDFDMQAAASNEPDASKQQAVERSKDQVLDLLDTLEKASSRRTWKQQWTEKGPTGEPQRYELKLINPEVQTKDRKAWTVKENGNNLEFSLVTPSRSAAAEYEKVLGDATASGLKGVTSTVNRGAVKLIVPKAMIGEVSRRINLDTVAKVDNYARPTAVANMGEAPVQKQAPEQDEAPLDQTGVAAQKQAPVQSPPVQQNAVPAGVSMFAGAAPESTLASILPKQGMPNVGVTCYLHSAVQEIRHANPNLAQILSKAHYDLSNSVDAQVPENVADKTLPDKIRNPAIAILDGLMRVVGQLDDVQGTGPTLAEVDALNRALTDPAPGRRVELAKKTYDEANKGREAAATKRRAIEDARNALTRAIGAVAPDSDPPDMVRAEEEYRTAISAFERWSGRSISANLFVPWSTIENSDDPLDALYKVIGNPLISQDALLVAKREEQEATAQADKEAVKRGHKNIEAMRIAYSDLTELALLSGRNGEQGDPSDVVRVLSKIKGLEFLGEARVTSGSPPTQGQNLEKFAQSAVAGNNLKNTDQLKPPKTVAINLSAFARETDSQGNTINKYLSNPTGFDYSKTIQVRVGTGNDARTIKLQPEAVVYHFGDDNDGHYVPVLRRDDGKWVQYDDAKQPNAADDPVKAVLAKRKTIGPTDFRPTAITFRVVD